MGAAGITAGRHKITVPVTDALLQPGGFPGCGRHFAYLGGRSVAVCDAQAATCEMISTANLWGIEWPDCCSSWAYAGKTPTNRSWFISLRGSKGH